MDHPITQADLRAAVTSEIRQQMTTYVLQLDQTLDDVRMIKWTLYGNEKAGELGLVRGVKSMQEKLDKIIELSEARENQWKGIKTALVVIGSISSVPALQIVLPAIGKLFGALAGNP